MQSVPGLLASIVFSSTRISFYALSKITRKSINVSFRSFLRFLHKSLGNFALFFHDSVRMYSGKKKF